LFRTDTKWRNGGRWLSLALLGGLAINATPVEAAAASSPVQSWISLTDGHLCRTWSAPTSAIRQLTASIPSIVAPGLSVNTLTFDPASQRSQNAKGLATDLKVFTVSGASSVAITHCSSQWHISSDNRLISDAPAWVPNPTGAWPTPDDNAETLMLYVVSLKTESRMGVNVAPKAEHKVMTKARRTKPNPYQNPGPINPGPGGIGPWTPVPGHPSYGVSDFAGDPYSAEFGQCTWWAWYTRRDESQLGTLGMARDWIANARARGMRTGYSPAVGATAVFQPGVQGAGSGGHVGHVVQILSGGWFIISEMNFAWNGGGWGRVDYRYVHTGSGVAFIY
jgi:surface antigen